ncbi:hypothetical protein [Catellatospora sp. NPDC049609]|uniref:hypothetical protein n=1 Tax=Catellatospora sp. NPDC049609 TaxID=3155505 RepID=UPI0034444774
MAQDLDVSAQDVQNYVARLVEQDGESAVIAQQAADPAQVGLTDAAARRVRVQLSH